MAMYVARFAAWAIRSRACNSCFSYAVFADCMASTTSPAPCMSSKRTVKSRLLLRIKNEQSKLSLFRVLQTMASWVIASSSKRLCKTSRARISWSSRLLTTTRALVVELQWVPRETPTFASDQDEAGITSILWSWHAFLKASSSL